MTILKSVFNGYKFLSSFIPAKNPYQEVERLSDHHLKDIGMYREGGVIYSLVHSPELDKSEAQHKSADQVIFIPAAVQDSGG